MAEVNETTVELTESERLLENKDIDALVDLFAAWLERRKPALTVEQALAELREMFPNTWLSIEVSWKPVIGHYYFIRVYGKPKRAEAKPTLNEAMDQIRKWQQEQKG